MICAEREPPSIPRHCKPGPPHCWMGNEAVECHLAGAEASAKCVGAACLCGFVCVCVCVLVSNYLRSNVDLGEIHWNEWPTSYIVYMYDVFLEYTRWRGALFVVSILWAQNNLSGFHVVGRAFTTIHTRISPQMPRGRNCSMCKPARPITTKSIRANYNWRIWKVGTNSGCFLQHTSVLFAYTIFYQFTYKRCMWVCVCLCSAEHHAQTNL